MLTELKIEMTERERSKSRRYIIALCGSLQWSKAVGFMILDLWESMRGLKQFTYIKRKW